MAERQRRQAEAQYVGIAKVADNAARDERLHDFIGMWVAEGDMAAAFCGVGGGDAFKACGGSGGVENVPECRRFRLDLGTVETVPQL